MTRYQFFLKKSKIIQHSRLRVIQCQIPRPGSVIGCQVQPVNKNFLLVGIPEGVIGCHRVSFQPVCKNFFLGI